MWVINLVSDWSPHSSQPCKVQSLPTCISITERKAWDKPWIARLEIVTLLARRWEAVVHSRLVPPFSLYHLLPNMKKGISIPFYFDFSNHCVYSLKNQSWMTSVYLQTEVAPLAQTLKFPSGLCRQHTFSLTSCARDP